MRLSGWKAANQQPQTLAESLGLLEDRWRLMLIRASHGDREELDAAVATILQWWDAMPKALRSNIDACSHAWRKDHPVSDKAANRRRVQQMLTHLRERPGTNRLAVAVRLPA